LKKTELLKIENNPKQLFANNAINYKYGLSLNILKKHFSIMLETRDLT